MFRASVTACTRYGVKYLKDAGNSFARDLGQDAKEDCEIGFVALGGEHAPLGEGIEKGAVVPSHPSPHPVGSRAGVRGWGEGAAKPLVLGAAQWDGPFNPSYPSCLGTSPEDQKGWAVTGAWCP